MESPEIDGTCDRPGRGKPGYSLAMTPYPPARVDTAIDPERFALLSAREGQILSLAALGLADKQISQDLGLSLNTLRTYWTRIRTKVGDSSRAGLTAAYIGYAMAGMQPEESAALDLDRHEGWVYDPRTKLTMASDRVNDFSGLARGVAHNLAAYLEGLDARDRVVVEEAMRRILAGDAISMHLRVRLHVRGKDHQFNCLLSARRDEEGHIDRISWSSQAGRRRTSTGTGPSTSTLGRSAGFARAIGHEGRPAMSSRLRRSSDCSTRKICRG
ncbi:LuxR family transcriptional regulator [bacterium]|nr:MAG: LuxR family transcriptional regulator [bacterium]